MRVVAKQKSKTLTIYLEGELDDSSVEEVRNKSDELIERSNNLEHLVYDFTKLKFMDSTGIGMILGRYNKLKRLNIPITIANPNSQVLKVINITGLNEILNIK